MPTECSQDSFAFGTVEGRVVVGVFDGGQITSDAGALLLGQTSKAIGLVSRLANCFQGCVTEEPLGSEIPTGDDAVEVLADDRVVRRFDDRCEPVRTG